MLVNGFIALVDTRLSFYAATFDTELLADLCPEAGFSADFVVRGHTHGADPEALGDGWTTTVFAISVVDAPCAIRFPGYQHPAKRAILR
jgi:hypothetical protein